MCLLVSFDRRICFYCFCILPRIAKYLVALPVPVFCILVLWHTCYVPCHILFPCHSHLSVCYTPFFHSHPLLFPCQTLIVRYHTLFCLSLLLLLRVHALLFLYCLLLLHSLVVFGVEDFLLFGHFPLRHFLPGQTRTVECLGKILPRGQHKQNPKRIKSTN